MLTQSYEEDDYITELSVSFSFSVLFGKRVSHRPLLFTQYFHFFFGVI